ncbi:MAG TPA: hypothetical protein VNF07_01680 [Acidimicrobiales bacterium]|nr:hypothetical protein [Acidimicrobiales bacterium]
MANEQDPTRVDDATRDAEAEEARTTAHADRPPTPEEEELADEAGGVDEDVAAHEKEMLERGANVKGEGAISPS